MTRRWVATLAGVIISVSAVGCTQPPEPEPDPQRTTVTRWVDGDTVVTTAGTVRLIGIDTPERGQACYRAAGAFAATVAPPGSDVYLPTADGRDQTDRYGRLLRYVTTPTGDDVGRELIEAGYARARYDSLDGYGAHPLEDAYHDADDASEPATC